MIAEQTDHNINGGNLSFDLSSADFSNRVNVYASFQHIARKSYYGSKQDPDAYGRTHDLTVATGAQYIHSFDRLWFLPADLTLGVEYNYNDLDDESIGYDYRTKQRCTSSAPTCKTSGKTSIGRCLSAAVWISTASSIT